MGLNSRTFFASVALQVLTWHMMASADGEITKEEVITLIQSLFSTVLARFGLKITIERVGIPVPDTAVQEKYAAL